MATARLSRDDKNSLNTRLYNICDRLLYLPEDPINKVGMGRINFIKTLIPNDMCKALKLVETTAMAAMPAGTSSTRRRYRYQVISTTSSMHFHIMKAAGIKLSFGTELEGDDGWYSLPDEMFRVHPSHPLHNSLLSFGNNHLVIADRVARAQGTLRHIVYKCSSVGQIQRVIPNIMDFVPSDLSSTLASAERRSRAPVLDTEDKATPARIADAISVLAFGTLKPQLDHREQAMCITVGEQRVR